MRVLMFGWEFPPHISGGLGSACQGIVTALTSKGTEVLFVLPRLAKALKKQEKGKLTMRAASGIWIPLEGGYAEQVRVNAESYWQKNLQIHSIDSTLFPYATPQFYEYEREEYLKRTLVHIEKETVHISPSGYAISLQGGYGKDLLSEVYRYSIASQVIAKEENFDVIHAHDWMAYPAGILAKEISGKPLICHIHATEADRCGETNLSSPIAEIERKGLHAADRIVAVSHFTKNLIMRVYGVPEAKISVVHNAVSRKEAGMIYRTPINKLGIKQVLFMGRVTFQKGPDYFVEAARLVHNMMPDVRFVMAGAGDMLKSMIARVAKYRLGRRFTFTGFLRGDEVDRMYASSDLYVMPSVSEPFGIAPLEAMVYDVPVLMSKQSGVSEVISNALKVDFWDVRKMASSICAVLAYPAIGRLMVKNCQQELKTIRWDNAADKLNRIYREVVSEEK